MDENKYLEGTGHDTPEDLSMKEQLRLLVQRETAGEWGYLLWRRQGGATGSWPLGFFETESAAENAKEFIEEHVAPDDRTGRYQVEEL